MARKRASRVDALPEVAQADPSVTPEIAPLPAFAAFSVTGEAPVMMMVTTPATPASVPAVAPVAASPAEPEASDEKKPYIDPAEELKREAEAVAKLVTTLKDMGVTCTDAITASIESETNFTEMLEARIRAEGEIDAMMSGLNDYIATLNARVGNLKKAKDAIREVMKLALKKSERDSIPTAYGTVYTISGKFSTVVKSEALIPAAYYKQVLDTSKLTDALKARKAALDAVNKIVDDGERAEARKLFLETYPVIEGADYVQGLPSLGIRRK